MPYVYMLRCADDSIYVGSTWNAERREWEHNQGLGAEYTRHRRPVFLIWQQEYERVEEAYAMEKRLQGWGHDKREALAYGGVEAVKGWSARQRRKKAGG